MRSLSPRHFEANVAEETLKKVVPHSVATALARRVFPVPGGPNMRTPFHGRRIPCSPFISPLNLDMKLREVKFTTIHIEVQNQMQKKYFIKFTFAGLCATNGERCSAPLGLHLRRRGGYKQGSSGLLIWRRETPLANPMGFILLLSGGVFQPYALPNQNRGMVSVRPRVAAFFPDLSRLLCILGSQPFASLVGGGFIFWWQFHLAGLCYSGALHGIGDSMSLVCFLLDSSTCMVSKVVPD
eukprot:Gb_41464 [translate_table: standard]